jgi:osmotically-inducible protein OsmY
MDRNPYRASGGPIRLDEDIRTEIQARLDEDPLVDARSIFVSVSNGRVLLQGSVGNYEEKRRAETSSRQVSGIVGNDSNLTARRSR